MEYVPTLKCELMAFLVPLDYTDAYFKMRKSTYAWITNNIYVLAATVLNGNSY